MKTNEKELSLGLVRSDDRYILSAEILIRSKRRRSIYDPDCESVIMIRIQYIDCGFWCGANPAKHKRLFRVDVDTGEFFYKAAKYEFTNGKDILEKIREKLCAYF